MVQLQLLLIFVFGFCSLTPTASPYGPGRDSVEFACSHTKPMFTQNLFSGYIFCISSFVLNSRCESGGRPGLHGLGSWDLQHLMT